MLDGTKQTTYGNVAATTDPVGKGGIAGQFWVNTVSGKVWAWDAAQQAWLPIIG